MTEITKYMFSMTVMRVGTVSFFKCTTNTTSGK